MQYMNLDINVGFFQRLAKGINFASNIYNNTSSLYTKTISKHFSLQTFVFDLDVFPS